MADVEFNDLAHRSYLLRGGKIEAVAGVNFEARAFGESGPAHDALEFGGAGRAVPGRHGVAPGAGVNLDDRRADCRRRVDLRRLRGDEEGNTDTGLRELADRPAQDLALAGDIEPAFGGTLLAPFGNDASRVRAYYARDLDHVARRRHFEVQWPGETRLQAHDVVIDDVTAILAQMRGDPVGAGRDRDLGGPYRIGMPAAARIAHGRDVIDVDAETDRRRSRWHDKDLRPGWSNARSSNRGPDSLRMLLKAYTDHPTAAASAGRRTSASRSPARHWRPRALRATGR